MKRQFATACLLLVLSATSFMWADDNRFALVIGNGNYSQGRLKNPANDAKLISKSLSELGFSVETKIDLDQQSMETAISSFSRSLPENSFAFFFYAGHGIQAKKSNFLIPTGATLNSEASLKYRTVPLDFVRDELENSKSNLNVVVLDCCRNNPFERSWNRSLVQSGFAPLSPVPEGTVIAFATGDGKTAADGEGENSPYTRELAAALSARPEQGLSLVEGVFFTLGRTLKPKTQQHPHLYVDSTMPKYFLWEPAKGQNENPPSPMPEQISASKELPAKVPTPGPLPSQQSDAKQSDDGKDLLAQATRYHSEGEFDYAITAFGALISDPDIPRNIRDQARKGRGGSYLAKGTAETINRAIIDFKAANEPGIQLSVMRSEAELRDAKIVTGKVHRNESVLLTQSKGDWLWVESVQGNKSRQGWIKCSAFLATPSLPNSPAVSVVMPNQIETKPSDLVTSALPSNFQPSTSAVTKSEPSVQPFGSSPLQITPTTSGSPVPSQHVNFDQHGNPVRQTTQVPVNQPQPTITTRQLQSYQVDQYGNRISTQSAQPYSAARQTTNIQPLSVPPSSSQSSNIVYFDQNGRQINPGLVQNQQQFNVNQPQASQQQFYQPPQQNYQQQTSQQQTSTRLGFGNQNRQIFQPQTQGGKMFQSPMRSHVQRMKSFGFGN
ncbi:MAG: caspase family protein [Pirellulaceae bacterium]